MSSEDIERRKRLESAVEDDDWSSVIDGQTKLTEEPKVEEAPTATIIRLDALATEAIMFLRETGLWLLRKSSCRTASSCRTTYAVRLEIASNDCDLCTPALSVLTVCPLELEQTGWRCLLCHPE